MFVCLFGILSDRLPVCLFVLFCRSILFLLFVALLLVFPFHEGIDMKLIIACFTPEKLDNRTRELIELREQHNAILQQVDEKRLLLLLCAYNTRVWEGEVGFAFEL